MSSRDRLLDLVVSRATEGLAADEALELEQALHGQTDLDRDDLDLAAAAVYLAFDAGRVEFEPMPEALKRRILGSDRRGK